VILTVNCGSSSVRLDAFAGDPPARVASGRSEGSDARAPLPAFLARCGQPVEVVAHRIVHGGELSETTRIDDATERAIEALSSLAPLHNAPALAGIRAARERLPDAAHFAVFDTAFFARLPVASRTYALPLDLARAHGLRRYGFHGLAHRAMWERWAALRPEHARAGRAITFQLGAGCSAAAIRGGAPLDTSMGFTPLEGLVMATRPGDVDAGLLTHLQRVARLDAAALDRLLYTSSGLAGLAGESSVSRLLARDDAEARLAVEVYCHRARRYLGAFLAVLGGADAVVFGGGVGENVPAIRQRILAGMEWAGIELDPGANSAPGTDGRIGASDSGADLRVVAVDEAALLAAEARAAMS
jgi:acetate kinase